MTPPRIEAATLADVDEIAELYTHAFADNAAYSDIFRDQPTEEGKLAAFRWLFRARLRLILGKGCPVLVAKDEGGRIVASAGLVPASKRYGVIDMIANGLLEWPFRFGLPSLLRALGRQPPRPAPGPSGEVRDAAAEISMVAVHESLRGKGVGSALVRRLLEHWDGEEAGEERRRRGGGGGRQEDDGPIMLDTQKEENVRFYERLGFRMVGVDSSHGYRSWTFQRDAPAAAAASTTQR